MDALELATRYKIAIEGQLGLVGEIADGNIAVKFRYPEFGVFYFAIDAKDDPAYMMLIFPNFADKDSTGGDINKLVELANKVNGSNKSVKLLVGDDSNVTANIECYLAAPEMAPSQELLNSVIKRNVTAIRAAVATFRLLAKRGGDAEGERDADEKSSA